MGSRRPVLFAVALLAIAGCERIEDLTGRGPESAVSGYLDATTRGDAEAAYGFLSADDRAARSLSEYRTQAGSEFAKALLGKTKYTVIGVTRSGDTATARVEMQIPDVSGMLGDVLGGAFASAFGGAKQEDIEKKLAEKYQGADLPVTTKVEEFTLLHEPDGWRVFLDWATQDRVAQLLREARDVKKADPRSALEKYNAALELDSQLVEARKERDETQRDIAVFEEKQAYIGNVVLYDLAAKRYDSFLDKNIPGVEFKLRNNGDRTLKRVQVTVYFKDAAGAVIAEEEYNPVLVTEFSFGGDNKPLRPNYIWQMEHGKFYKADSVPSEWEEGSVSARITDLEFAEESAGGS